jgi:secreted protein with Ig-like and vWFA domain
MAGEVALTTLLNTDGVAANGEPRLVYLLVDVRPGIDAEPLAAPVNLAVVLDVSESMRLPVLTQEQFLELKRLGQVNETVSDGVPVWTFKSIPEHIREHALSNLEAVQRAISRSTEHLDAHDLVSLVAFAERAQALLSGISGLDRDRVNGTVASLGSVSLGDGTDMATGLGVGIVEVRRNAAPDMLNRILVLTDGFTEDAERVGRLTVEARQAGIAISTVGIGSEFNEKLLVDVADASLGNAYFARLPQEIPTAFGQELAAVQSVIMKGVAVEVGVSAGVEIRRAYRVRPTIATVTDAQVDGRTLRVNMGDLDPLTPPALLLEMIVPTRTSGNFRIARVALSHEESPQVRGTVASSDVVLRYTTSGRREELNPVVMNTVEKVTAYALQTRALEDAAAGNVQAATRRLRAAATRLLTMGEAQLAQAAEAEASRLEQEGQISPEGAKELRYATRRLTQRLSG